KIALDTGAYGFITKPFKRNEVVIAVENALRRRRLEIDARRHRAALEDRVVERAAEVDDAHARLRVAHEETVLRLSMAVEFRDPETGSHIERMSQYCALLAVPLGLDAETVRVASRLHDVGKIAVADSILLKPGLLTPDERREMERHAEVGHELLTGSRSDLLDVAATIAWTHHEWFDGSGYPHGLRGDDIPLVGRVAAVADVFDALTTNRPYRPAIAIDDALDMLTAERGGHFDPHVVDVFLDRLADARGIIARFAADAEAPAGTDGQPATLVTLSDAAETLGVSPSTMRRWADEGRIPVVRTAGGHRRFPLDAVRRFADEHGTRPTIRPVAPPRDRVATLAGTLEVEGADLVAKAAALLYRGAKPGWFAASDALPDLTEWLAELGRGFATGQYTNALEASELLMRSAQLHASPLLERHTFLERFRDVALRSLSQHGAEQADPPVVRRVVAAVQQAMLDRYT
ncbi:MAG: cyclic di-GMP phosphodiesterase, partial [Solirubrobacteraceae bacterium]|nr:cyclic di-GMP phosphodiesterase [Solirubrobacteraceae bacterium]